MSYWKNVINSKNPVIHFDASIRKYYVDGKSIYHICKSCLSQAICLIPLAITAVRVVLNL